MGRRNNRNQIWKYHLEWSTWCGSCRLCGFLDIICIFTVIKDTRRETKTFQTCRKAAILLMGKVTVTGYVEFVFCQTDAMLSMALGRRVWDGGGLLEWRVNIRIRVQVMWTDNIEMSVQEEKACTSLLREKWKQEAAHFLWLIWRVMDESIVAETSKVFSF